MPVINQQTLLPTTEEPIGTFGQSSVPVRLRDVWYRFFQACNTLLMNLQNGLLGFTVKNNITATGTTQGTAFLLPAEWNVVTTTAANTGVLINNNYGPGVPQIVINRGANTLKVYPPVGAQIDVLGTNNPYSLVTLKQQTFQQITSTQWYSEQLG